MKKYEEITKDNCDESEEKRDFFRYSGAPMAKYSGPKSGTYLDLGGNHGWASVNAINLGFDRCVIFEPSTRSVSVLQERFKGDPRVEIINKAVGHPAREAFIETENKSLNHKVKDQFKQGFEKVVVVDAIAEIERIRPSFVKIDIEGSEYEFIGSWVPGESVQGFSVEFHSPDSEKNWPEVKKFLANAMEEGFGFDSPLGVKFSNGRPASRCINFIGSRCATLPTWIHEFWEGPLPAGKEIRPRPSLAQSGMIDPRRIITLKNSNPSTKGSRRWSSWEIMTSEAAMTVKRYEGLGGDIGDLNDRVKRGWAKLVSED